MNTRSILLAVLAAATFVLASTVATTSALADDCGGCPHAKNHECPHAKGKAQAAKAPMAFDKAPEAGTKATCPVMGNEFVVAKDSPRSEYKGKHYVFCCAGCKPQFDADPEKYIAK